MSLTPQSWLEDIIKISLKLLIFFALVAPGNCVRILLANGTLVCWNHQCAVIGESGGEISYRESKASGKCDIDSSAYFKTVVLVLLVLLNLFLVAIYLTVIAVHVNNIKTVAGIRTRYISGYIERCRFSGDPAYIGRSYFKLLALYDRMRLEIDERAKTYCPAVFRSPLDPLV